MLLLAPPLTNAAALVSLALAAELEALVLAVAALLDAGAGAGEEAGSVVAGIEGKALPGTVVLADGRVVAPVEADPVRRSMGAPGVAVSASANRRGVTWPRPPS